MSVTTKLYRRILHALNLCRVTNIIHEFEWVSKLIYNKKIDMKGKVSGSFSVSKAKENADNRSQKGILLRTGTLTTEIGLTREQSPEKAGLRSNGGNALLLFSPFPIRNLALD